ncbi:hypothetical protein [Ralstonia pseudosolanacearum]|uniref:hypothetical protein n=1 Tax=Ralstonia pseudosolanacearum TaxID=1310165 RepID=UPI001FFB1B24|nr:hypothetical protein [Ralstonia pseudosolanacearum]MDO3528998.1 hypothetical protein [Ralstonia pseudosolanacearum]
MAWSELKMEKISLTIPRDMRERIEAERRQMAQRVGFEPSFNQAATALLQRALATQTDFGTVPAGT